MTRRLILIDPGLVNATGHEAAHARTLALECRRRAISLDVLASAAADIGMCAAIPCRPIFRVELYARPRRRNVFATLAATRTWSRRYAHDFSRALTHSAGPRDLVLLNTATIAVLAGFARWLRGLPSAERPASAIVLRFDAGEGLPGYRYPAISRVLHRRVLDRLHRLLGWRLLLAADTRLIAEEFEVLVGRPVAAIPLPIVVPEATPPDPREPGVAHLVFPTVATPERGFHLLPDAFTTALARCPGLTVSVRIAGPRKSYAPLVDRLRTMGPRVRLVEGELDDGAFYALLASADGVLLPYDPRIFAKRSSQILAQSASLGRPVIVMANSFLDNERRAGGVVGIAAEGFTADALAEVIVRFVADRPRLAEAAWAACSTQRARHSAAAFIDSLLAFAGEAGKRSGVSEGASTIDLGKLGTSFD